MPSDKKAEVVSLLPHLRQAKPPIVTEQFPGRFRLDRIPSRPKGHRRYVRDKKSGLPHPEIHQVWVETGTDHVFQIRGQTNAPGQPVLYHLARYGFEQTVRRLTAETLLKDFQILEDAIRSRTWMARHLRGLCQTGGGRHLGLDIETLLRYLGLNETGNRID